VTAALRRLRRRLRAPRWTIGRELALLVFAALLPFAVLGLYWTHEDYRTEQGRSQARALRLARQVSASVDGLVEDTAALVEALARVPSVKRGEQPQTDALLAELVEQHPYFESLFVADAGGRILASGGQEVPSERRQTYVAAPLRAAQTVVTDAVAPGRDSRRLLVVATPLWDETGTPVGVVAASVGLLRLEEGLRQADLPENSSLLVVDRAGRVVTRRQDPGPWLGRWVGDRSAVRDALSRGEGASEGDFLDGVRRQSGFASPQRVPWVVVVGIPAVYQRTAPKSSAFVPSVATIGLRRIRPIRKPLRRPAPIAARNAMPMAGQSLELSPAGYFVRITT